MTILQFLDGHSDLFAVNDFDASQYIVNNHLNILAVLQHDCLDLALHN